VSCADRQVDQQQGDVVVRGLRAGMLVEGLLHGVEATGSRSACQRGAQALKTELFPRRILRFG
jgi:hypothetical protein